MEQNLTDELIAGFEAIRHRFALAQDETARKGMILETCRQLSGKYDNRVAANTMSIIHHYVSAGNVELPGLIRFLESNKDLDYQTLLREERDGFDKQYGTVTSSILRQYELPEEVSLYRFKTSNRCHPSPVASVKMALKELPEYGVRYEDYVFIDIGSGLGRNLLLASAHPFRKIIGIEHSQYLTDITRENIRIYQSPEQQCKSIEVHCADAFQYEFPQENLVLYFWRPFTDEVAAAYLKKLEAFVQQTPYKLVLVFLGLVYPVIRNAPSLELLNIEYTPDLMNETEYFPITFLSGRKNNSSASL